MKYILKCEFPFSSATTSILRDHANLWPGSYKVAVEVKDQQGKSCADVEIVDVDVCSCKDQTKTCRERTPKTADFGAPGILLMLLGLLLLLCEYFLFTFFFWLVIFITIINLTLQVSHT